MNEAKEVMREMLALEQVMGHFQVRGKIRKTGKGFPTNGTHKGLFTSVQPFVNNSICFTFKAPATEAAGVDF